MLPSDSIVAVAVAVAAVVVAAGEEHTCCPHVEPKAALVADDSTTEAAVMPSAREPKFCSALWAPRHHAPFHPRNHRLLVLCWRPVCEGWPHNHQQGRRWMANKSKSKQQHENQRPTDIHTRTHPTYNTAKSTINETHLPFRSEALDPGGPRNKSCQNEHKKQGSREPDIRNVSLFLCSGTSKPFPVAEVVCAH